MEKLKRCLQRFSLWLKFGGSFPRRPSTDNVASLKRAWTFHTGDKSGFFESTPLVIDSVMYFASGSAFFALDAVTGQQIWKVPAVKTTRRGVSYWPGDAKRR